MYSKYRSMFKKKRNFTGRLALSYLTVISIVLILAFSTFYLVLMRRSSLMIDTIIKSYAVQLAKTDIIKDALIDEHLDESFIKYLDEIVKNEEYVDYIVITKKDNTRLYHPNKELIGESFQGGDENLALEGSEPYFTQGKGTREYQRRCFCSVYDDGNNPIGFVMVSCHTSQIVTLYRTELLRFLGVLLFSFFLGIVFSQMIARVLKKRLLGYEPAHIAELFQQRDDILNSLNEGLVLMDNNNECAYMNETAKKLLSLEEDTHNEKLNTFINKEVLIDDEDDAIHQVKVENTDRTLMVSNGAINHNDKRIGTLVLLNDMTRLNRLAEELTGVKHIIDALRATTHEQKNRLHVILGLLQLGEMDEAIEFITQSVNSEEKNSNIINTIENKTIAALILGKINKAKELNIEFQLVKGSYLEAHNEYLSAQDLVTIIGNLVENAFDAIGDKEGERKVDLFISCSDEWLMIIVDDTGSGMSEEVKEKLLTEEYTSKGEGHGVGLRLIKDIVKRSHGEFNIETEEGEGSSFTVTIQEKRKMNKG